jgi:hypothetical protein
MAEPDFEVGKFYQYRATDGINLGFIDTTQGGYDAKRDEVIQYDGSTVILKDKREYVDVPQLRGAIRQGWFVPVENTDAVYRPQAAGIEVRATEQRGRDKPQKHTVVTHRAEEDAVGSVADRKKDREKKFAAAVVTPSLETPEAQEALGAFAPTYVAEDADIDIVEWDSGNDEVNEIAAILDQSMVAWYQTQITQQQEEEMLQAMIEERDAEQEAKDDFEADLLSLLNDIENEPKKKPKRKATKARAAAPKPKGVTTKSAAPLTPTSEPKLTVGSPQLKMPVERQERLQMPVHKADETENHGKVITTVKEQRKMAVEQEKELSLNVAPATPSSPKPPARLGGAGVMVVDDDQMDLGKIALSQNNAADNTSTAESAKAKPASTEGVQMGGVEVGRKKKMAMPIQEAGDDGVVVGKILSPARRDFTATPSNTSAGAIERAEGGKQLKVEHYEQPTTKVASVTTGDVDEAREGESLEEILPDAATPPKPAPKVYLRPEDNPAYQAVKLLIPDFEWNMDRPVSQRVAEAMKYVKKPQFMKGIIAVETDLAKSEIKAKLAEVLKVRKAAEAEAADESSKAEA